MLFRSHCCSTYVDIQVEFSQKGIDRGCFRRARFTDEENRPFDTIAELKEPVASARVNGRHQDFVEFPLGIMLILGYESFPRYPTLFRRIEEILKQRGLVDWQII